MKRISALAAAATLAALAAAPASAQSTEEVLGAAIGGSLGAVIGGEIDTKGSSQEGEILGAIIGGTVGYAIGEQIDHRNDRNAYYRDRYGRPVHTTQRYQSRYPVQDYSYGYGYPQPRVVYDTPYYGQRGKAHPVFAQHPGRGHGVHKRRHRHYR